MDKKIDKKEGEELKRKYDYYLNIQKKIMNSTNSVVDIF